MEQSQGPKKKEYVKKQIDRQYTDISSDNSSTTPPTSSSLNTGQSDMESDYSEVEPFESEYSMLNNMIIEGFSDNENSMMNNLKKKLE